MITEHNADEQKLIRAFETARDLDFKVAIKSKDHQYGGHVFILLDRLLAKADGITKISPNLNFSKIIITFADGETGQLEDLEQNIFDAIIREGQAFLHEYICSK